MWRRLALSRLISAPRGQVANEGIAHTDLGSVKKLVESRGTSEVKRLIFTDWKFAVVFEATVRTAPLIHISPCPPYHAAV
jgi:hypothetical protein